MPLTLTLAKSENSDVLHVTAEGEATAHDFPSVDNSHFDELLGAHWDQLHVMLDLRRVTYLDSLALGWLVTTQKSFRAGGGKFVIHSLQPQVRHLIESLKIDRVVPVAPDVNAANAFFHPRKASLAS